MLLTLLMNNLMEGSGPPVPSRQTGDNTLLEALTPVGGLYDSRREQEARGSKKLREKEEEDIIYHMISFILCQE